MNPEHWTCKNLGRTRALSGQLPDTGEPWGIQGTVVAILHTLLDGQPITQVTFRVGDSASELVTVSMPATEQ